MMTIPILLSILVTAFIVYASFGMTLFFMQKKLLYKPVKDVLFTPKEIGLDFEQVEMTTSDGVTLSGWYVPAEPGEFTLLFCHGNGGNISHRLDSLDIFNRLGLNCFLFDYRGYGKSTGLPTEDGTYLDARTCYDWLLEQKGISPEKLIISGRSLGAAIAAQLATNVRTGALVLESAFTSYADIGKKIYPYFPVHLFANYRYNTAEYLKNVNCPVMIIHSRDDGFVPFEFALQLHNLANEPKQLVEIYGNHNGGFMVSAQIYKKAWQQWVDSLKNQTMGKNAALEDKNYIPI